MPIEEAIKTAIEFEAQARDVYRDDVEGANEIGFPLSEKRPWGNQ